MIRISALAAFMLILLRIAIGWHFLYEGLWKYENPGFSAEGFLKQARGPFAEKFHALVPDYEGRQRLDPEHIEGAWKRYTDQVETFYNFSDEQTAAVQKIYDRRQRQLQLLFDEIEEDRKSYFEDLDQLKKDTLPDRPFQEISSYLKKRLHDRKTALQAKAAPWLSEIDRLDREFKAELEKLLDRDQQERGAMPLSKTTLAKINQWTTYGFIAIGLCLIAGLFTRTACLAGGLFLLSVVLSQPAWPTIYPPLPPSAGHSLIVTKEFIEMLAMFALMTTPVGRWGGLDFFIHHLFTRPCCGRKGTH